MAALAAGLGAAMAGGPEEANAQASDIMLPHPDGEITVEVSSVALDTQAEILAHLQDCLREGFAFADVDGNQKIEGDERFDWDDERAFCAEAAQSDFEQAALRERIETANAGIVAADARIAAANAEIQALTQNAMEEIREEGL